MFAFSILCLPSLFMYIALLGDKQRVGLGEFDIRDIYLILSPDFVTFHAIFSSFSSFPARFMLGWSFLFVYADLELLSRFERDI